MTTVSESTYTLSPMYIARRPMFNHYVWFRATMMTGLLNLMTPEEKEIMLRIMFTDCMWDHRKPDVSMEELMKRMVR